MSAVSLPVNRPVGKALVIAAPGARTDTRRILGQLGYEFGEADDPYTGFVELNQSRFRYTAVILGLSSLYREELAIVSAIKRKLPHLEIWLTQTDGRHAALADCMRQGADGLLAEDGLHRIAEGVASESESPNGAVEATGDDQSQSSSELDDSSLDEPVLSSEELRALLQEQPIPPGASSL